MPTNRLLARLKRSYSCEESFEMSDREGFYENVENLIEFKDTLQWKSECEKTLKDSLEPAFDSLKNGEMRRLIGNTYICDQSPKVVAGLIEEFFM